MRTIERKVKKVQGKEPSIQTVQLEPDEAESLVYMMAMIGAILDRMDEMKGSVFYSKQVIDCLELYAKTKMKKPFSGQYAGEMADRVVHVQQVFREFVGSMVKLVDQPEQTKRIFDATLHNAFITAGVLPKVYEPMKFKDQ